MAYTASTDFSRYVKWLDGSHTYLECTFGGKLNISIDDALTQMVCTVTGLNYTSNTNLDPGGGFWNMFVLGWEMKYLWKAHDWNGATPGTNPEATTDTAIWNEFLADYRAAHGEDMKFLFQYGCYDDTPHYEKQRTGQTTYTRPITDADWDENHQLKDVQVLNFATRQWDEANTRAINRTDTGVKISFQELDWSYVPFAVFHGSQFVSCDADKTAWKVPGNRLITNDLYKESGNNAFVLIDGVWQRAPKITN